MRLFIALDAADDIRTRIERFLEGISAFAPEVRWVRPESLHVTLKFIGDQSDYGLEQIKQALSGVRCEPFQLTFRGHGFFPGPTLPRIFWIGVEGGSGLASLAAAIEEALVVTGVPKENHPFSPHITLARAGSRASGRQREYRPNRSFKRLQEKLAALPSPEFGTMTACEFFLFESRLSAEGSRYKKISRIVLQ
jgi:2'-5' RNA ligase